MDNLNIETNDKKEKSMKYYNFFTKVYLPIVTVLNAIIFFSDLGNIQKWNIYLIALGLVNIVLYVILPIKLIIGLLAKDKFGYRLTLLYLTLDFIYHIVIGTVNVYLRNPNVNLEIYPCIFFIIYSIWYIPNMIYFTNRKNEFIK